jgi:CRISPR-associated protein Cas1
MKRLLNTLYITTQDAWLSRERENVLVRVQQEAKMRFPIHTLGSIVGFGQVSASAPLMGLCAERGVSLIFFTEYGRFLARVEGPVSGNVLLRRAQYRRSDDPQSAAELAATLIAAKIANSRYVLQRSLRDRPDGPMCQSLQDTIDHLATLQRRVRRESMDIDSLRGYEGAAARAYFDVFDHLILGNKEAFCFEGRSRRPPRDFVNAMLSFVYTLLRHDIAAGLEGVGLDPAVGFLHRDRPGRPALALDLMEELRSPLADRLVLALINRSQVKPGGFSVTESGAVSMDDDTRRTVLVAWQERKRESIRHPYLEETVEIGLVPHLQARLLAKFLRGDLDAYPAFIWR